MKKLNITFCSYPDFSGNAKALYEYMKKRYKDNMNFVWIVYEIEMVNLLNNQGIKAILIGSKEFEEYIPTTDVFFTTQGNLDGDKVKTNEAIYIELWHGIGPKPVGFACENPSEQDVLGYSNISEIVDCFIVPNDFWKVIFGATFKVENKRIKKLGMPILYYFKYSNGKENLSKVININIEKYDKIIMYMPTYKKGFNHNDVTIDNNNIFNFKEDFDVEELDKYLKENNYLLCIKKHPGDSKDINFENTSNIVNIDEKKLNSNGISVNEIINAFDLLITDYSSIGTEFLFLERPVLFITSDIEEYKNNRGILFGNFDFWMPGPKVNNIKSLYLETSKLLNNNNYFYDERRKCRELWFGDATDGGCDKICDYIFDGNQISKNFYRYESKIINLQNEIKENEELMREKDSIIDARNARIRELDEFISNIINSKGWQVLEKMRNIKKKILKNNIVK